MSENDDWLSKMPVPQTSDEMNALKFMKHYIAGFGGPKEFVQHTIDREEELNRHWREDADVIGRILRAHLYIEHVVGIYLNFNNPSLGSLSGARLTYHQKLSLLPTDDRIISLFMPGFRRLNKVRNRVAHNMRGGVSDEDARIFAESPMFAPFAQIKIKNGSALPIDMLEDFSRFAAQILFSQCDAKQSDIIQRAYQMVYEKEQAAESVVKQPLPSILPAVDPE